MAWLAILRKGHHPFHWDAGVLSLGAFDHIHWNASWIVVNVTALVADTVSIRTTSLYYRPPEFVKNKVLLLG